MKLRAEDLDLIYFINISKETSNGSDNYIFWRNPKVPGPKYQLDIITVKEMKKMPLIFNHIRRGSIKICFYLENKILYIVGGKEELQFQIFEAIIEEVVDNFKQYYGDLKRDYKLVFEGLLEGFCDIIPEILAKIPEKVKLIRCFCRACDTDKMLYVKKSLIEDPNASYPVSLAYIHDGHALLVYIDKNFAVRGTEIINITE
ncbi:MAG: hypothetical protein ACTSRZ_07495 [Promethearchaeota archaeon]